MQGLLDTALSTYLRAEISTVGSGRTDSGVHAYTQLAHFEFDKTLIPREINYRLNALLPHDIVVKEVYQVNSDAHARFSPTSRAYQYYLSSESDPFRHGLFYYFYKEVDYDLMNEAAKILFEFTDFESFSKKHTDVHTFNCKITEAYWREEKGIYIFYIKADRFLRGMVRTIVGTLLEVGTGNLSLEGFKEIIKQKDRQAAGRAVPADGLFLWEVNYPEWVKTLPSS